MWLAGINTHTTLDTKSSSQAGQIPSAAGWYEHPHHIGYEKADQIPSRKFPFVRIGIVIQREQPWTTVLPPIRSVENCCAVVGTCAEWSCTCIFSWTQIEDRRHQLCACVFPSRTANRQRFRAQTCWVILQQDMLWMSLRSLPFGELVAKCARPIVHGTIWERDRHNY